MGFKDFLLGKESAESKRAKAYRSELQRQQGVLGGLAGRQLAALERRDLFKPARAFEKGRRLGEDVAGVEQARGLRALSQAGRQAVRRGQQQIARRGMGATSLGLLAGRLDEPALRQRTEMIAQAPLQRRLRGMQFGREQEQLETARRQGELDRLFGMQRQFKGLVDMPQIKFGRRGGLLGAVKKVAGPALGAGLAAFTGGLSAPLLGGLQGLGGQLGGSLAGGLFGGGAGKQVGFAGSSLRRPTGGMMA
jgi:hypothetical protein